MGIFGRSLRVLVVGDSITLPTGLARITRQIIEMMERLGWEVAQLGLGYAGQYTPLCHVYPLRDGENWGVGDLPFTLNDFKPDAVFTVWDPARCYPIAEYFKKKHVEIDQSSAGAVSTSTTRFDRDAERYSWTFKPKLWGYFPIDGTNIRGSFGGPAAEAVRWYDEVLGYNQWGAEILSRVLGGKQVNHVPHPLENTFLTPTWCWKFPPELERWVNASPIIGSVMANQPRKDFGVLFATWAKILKVYPNAAFWLHTDYETKHWAVAELASIWLPGKQDRLLVTTRADDQRLAQFYQLCSLTLLPSLGEGWGYPIVESLACGTPVIHTGHAAGADLVPNRAWLSPPVSWRQESVYCTVRPVLSSADFAQRAIAVLKEMESPLRRRQLRAYCSGSVAHLDPDNVWNYWREQLIRLHRTISPSTEEVEK